MDKKEQLHGTTIVIHCHFLLLYLDKSQDLFEISL